MSAQRQRSTNTESHVKRTRQSGKHVSSRRADGVGVPERLQEAIDIERDNLSKAESILGCLIIAMESASDGGRGPYYPDVAQIACELVRKSINGLDSQTLQQRLLRDRVQEAFPELLALHRDQVGYERLADGFVEKQPFATFGRTRVAPGLRLHRRCYGGRGSSTGSSAPSATVT